MNSEALLAWTDTSVDSPVTAEEAVSTTYGTDESSLRLQYACLDAEDDIEEPGDDQSDDEADDDDAADDEVGEQPAPTADGVPPGLAQVAVQARKKKRAHRVSVCTAKCRGSLHVVEQAARRLQYDLVVRDTPEVSISWLEHTDSTAMVSPFQVVSKIEGILQVCRKADLAAHIQAMQERFPDDYDFVPRTWIISQQLPDQVVDLEQTMEEKKGWTYICKPTAGSQGHGIRLVKNFSQLSGPLNDAFPRGNERLRPAEFVVQRYMTKPLLLDGYKFDCRCYVVVTGVVPLRAYLFREGLARFCTAKYEKPRGKNLSNACMHLTNYAVNKNSKAFCASRAHDAGSKRALSSVFSGIEADGGPSAESLWAEVKSVAEKTLLALRPALVERMSRGSRGALHPAGSKGFHILGFDVIFDEQYRATLLELNANSSMSVLQPVHVPKSAPTGKASSQAVKPRASTEVKTEVSELDLVIKTELIAQAFLCANPFPHGASMRRRRGWFEEIGGTFKSRGVCPPVDEPFPLDDDGELVHESAAPGPPRPDRPKRCPALQPLDFKAHPEADSFVRTHLLAYRIWRHYAFNPCGSLPLRTPVNREDARPRRYVGFGRLPFRALCEVAALIGVGIGPMGHYCWPDVAAADLFLARATRARQTISAPAGEEACSTLDFTRFLRRFAVPVGEVLLLAGQGGADPLEVFVERIWPAMI